MKCTIYEFFLSLAISFLTDVCHQSKYMTLDVYIPRINVYCAEKKVQAKNEIYFTDAVAEYLRSSFHQYPDGVLPVYKSKCKWRLPASLCGASWLGKNLGNKSQQCPPIGCVNTRRLLLLVLLMAKLASFCCSLLTEHGP